MEKERKQVQISVRNLVEFVLRSGDLDNRKTAMAQKEAMQAGSRIHRKIQKQMGADYQSEVRLKYKIQEDEFELLLEGRADGIMHRKGDVMIDEIKGTYKDLSILEEPVKVHLAQAMCYGYMYGKEKKLEKLLLQITYCNLETEEIRRFQVEKTLEELEEWFYGLLHEYLKWARYLYHHGLRRDESIRELEFPFPYRKGQRELAVAVYRTVVRERKLFIQAPTGIGKTLSTIFPSIKAIGEGYAEKLFYLTAKTITRKVAEEAFSILRERNLYFSTVTITAKEKLCFMEKAECNPDYCPYAKGHFDRINDAVYEVIHLEFEINREIILKYAEKFQVCPFEFCLDITDFVDGIICDYNYVFDPDVYLKRYFSEQVKGNYIFLVDEAHNLASRARDMYSAVLIKEDFLAAKRLIEKMSHAFASRFHQVNRLLLELKRECETYCILPDAVHLVVALYPLLAAFEKFLDEYKEFQGRDQVLELYFSVRHFLNIYDRVDENYRIYTEFLENGEFSIKLLCVNPIHNIKECLDRGISTVFFSATMLPLRYYRELLSNEPEDYTVYVPSPFIRENRIILAACDVTSRYSRRIESEYRKVLDYIYAMADVKKGNYMVFFPSYQYMKRILELAEQEKQPRGPEFLIQESDMKEQEREDFLKEFEREHKNSLVAFCVMGGLFSEGIDLKAEKLIGAAIVGTGLPMVCIEQEILKDFFDETDKEGFSFAYQYPGMNKVLQSAGRVIRTPEDQGVILLLDDRFLRRDYQVLFPREWDDCKRVTLKTVRAELKDFWREKEKSRQKEV